MDIADRVEVLETKVLELMKERADSNSTIESLRAKIKELEEENKALKQCKEETVASLTDKLDKSLNFFKDFGQEWGARSESNVEGFWKGLWNRFVEFCKSLLAMVKRYFDGMSVSVQVSNGNHNVFKHTHIIVTDASKDYRKIGYHQDIQNKALYLERAISTNMTGLI